VCVYIIYTRIVHYGVSACIHALHTHLAELLHGNTADIVGTRRALAVLALEDELVAHHRLVRPVVARPALAVVDLVYQGVVGLDIGF
jgi:hypothetical protein